MPTVMFFAYKQTLLTLIHVLVNRSITTEEVSIVVFVRYMKFELTLVLART